MRLVLVEWIDSHSGNGWQWRDELKSSAHPLKCRSVGWLFSDSDGALVIVPHASEGLGEMMAADLPFGKGCGEITIPTVCVVAIHDLRRDEPDAVPESP